MPGLKENAYCTYNTEYIFSTHFLINDQLKNFKERDRRKCEKHHIISITLYLQYLSKKKKHIFYSITSLSLFPLQPLKVYHINSFVCSFYLSFTVFVYQSPTRRNHHLFLDRSQCNRHNK